MRHGTEAIFIGCDTPAGSFFLDVRELVFDENRRPLVECSASCFLGSQYNDTIRRREGWKEGGIGN